WWPARTRRPPPRSTKRFSAPPAGGNIVSFRITSDRLSNDAGDTRPSVVVSIWNVGVVPIASALVMNRLASDSDPLLSTITSETGSLGVSTKWNALSAGIAAGPARTGPAPVGPGGGKGAEATDPGGL